jgi:hypothetical protein
MLVCLTDDGNDPVATQVRQAGGTIVHLDCLKEANELLLNDGVVEWHLSGGTVIKNDPTTLLISRICCLDSHRFFNMDDDALGVFLWRHLNLTLPLFNGLSSQPGNSSLCSRVPLLPIQWREVGALHATRETFVRAPQFEWSTNLCAEGFTEVSGPRAFYEWILGANRPASSGSYHILRETLAGNMIVTTLVGSSALSVVLNRDGHAEDLSLTEQSQLADLAKRLQEKWTLEFGELITCKRDTGELVFVELSPRFLISEAVEPIHAKLECQIKEMLKESAYATVVTG